jgi:hypothetical protein
VNSSSNLSLLQSLTRSVSVVCHKRAGIGDTNSQRMFIGRLPSDWTKLTGPKYAYGAPCPCNATPVIWLHDYLSCSIIGSVSDASLPGTHWQKRGIHGPSHHQIR